MKLMPILLDLKKQVLSGWHPLYHHEQDFIWESTLGCRSRDSWMEPSHSVFSFTYTGAALTYVSGDFFVFDDVLRGLIGNTTNLLALRSTIGGTPGAMTVDASTTPVTSPLPNAPYVGGRPFWSVVKWGSWLLATSGYDAQLKKYEPGVGFSVIAIPAPRVGKILATLGAYVLQFNSVASPTSFYWCSADDVTTWTPLSTNSAGDLLIREFLGPIRAVVPLGESLAVYTTTQMAIVEYIGAPYYFRYRMVFHAGAGAYNNRCVCAAGNFNYGLNEIGFFKTDGVFIQYFGEEQYEYLRASPVFAVGTGDPHECHCIYVPSLDEVWYYIGNRTVAYRHFAYNIKFDNWTELTESASSDGVMSFMPYGYPWAIDTDITLSIAGFNVRNYRYSNAVQSLVTKPLAFPIPDEKTITYDSSMKFIQTLNLQIEVLDPAYNQGGGVYMQIQYAVMNNLKETPNYITAAYEDGLIWVLKTGRYLKIRVVWYSGGNRSRQGAPWRLTGIRVTGKLKGR